MRAPCSSPPTPPPFCLAWAALNCRDGPQEVQSAPHGRSSAGEFTRIAAYWHCCCSCVAEGWWQVWHCSALRSHTCTPRRKGHLKKCPVGHQNNFLHLQSSPIIWQAWDYYSLGQLWLHQLRLNTQESMTYHNGYQVLFFQWPLYQMGLFLR